MRVGKQRHIQPWCYFPVAMAFFSLFLPKFRLFCGGNGAVGILLGTAGVCILHRVRVALSVIKWKPLQGFAGKLFAIVSLLWYTAVLIILTGSTALFIRDCFWTEMSVWVAWGLIILMLLPAWGKKKAIWQRLVAVVAPWLLVFVVGMPLLGIRQIQYPIVRGVLTLDMYQILTAAVVYLLASWYLLLIPGTGKKGLWPDSQEGLYLLLGFFLSGLCVLFGLVYGTQGTAYRRWPMLSLLQGVSVPGKFLERVDALWAAAFLFAVFVAAGLLLEKLFGCLQLLGVPEGSVRLWRWKDLVAFGLLLVALLVYRYGGVEVQDRAYVGAVLADWTEEGYVFWFPSQGKEKVTKVLAKSFTDARDSFADSQNLQPDFGHIEVTVLGRTLLKNRKMTDRLFTELAGWQEMDENSYAFVADMPGSLLKTDTGESGMGKYVSELYENRFGPARSHMTLQRLLVHWENEKTVGTLPELLEKNGCLWIREV